MAGIVFVGYLAVILFVSRSFTVAVLDYAPASTFLLIAFGLAYWRQLTAVLLAGGCAWYQEEKERAEILDTPSMDHMVAEVASFASSREQWPNDRWWTRFSSPELNVLEETALKDNPSLRKADARLREAQALVRVEGARLLPFLDADASSRTSGCLSTGCSRP